MTKLQIKEMLLLQFKLSFDINKHADLYSKESETFEHVVELESKGKDGKWIVASMIVSGEIHKIQSDIYYHNPNNDGRIGEAQGGDIEILDWNFTQCETLINNHDKVLFITFDELSNALKNEAH